MSSKVFNLGPGDLIPGPDLTITKRQDGGETATHTFTIRADQKDNALILAKLQKGTRLDELDDALPAFFSYLKLEEYEMRGTTGGLTEVVVQFTGVPETSESSSDRDVVYALRGVEVTRPILEHPEYKSNVSDTYKPAIAAIVHNTGYVIEPSSGVYEVRDRTSDEVLGDTISTGNQLTWFKIVHVEGKRDFTERTYEWTKSSTGSAGLSATDLTNYGKEDSSPDGNPPEPSGATGWWQVVDVQEERGTNSASSSITWRFIHGDPPTDIDYSPI